MLKISEALELTPILWIAMNKPIEDILCVAIVVIPTRLYDIWRRVFLLMMVQSVPEIQLSWLLKSSKGVIELIPSCSLSIGCGMSFSAA
jgi:hypothetical protein